MRNGTLPFRPTCASTWSRRRMRPNNTRRAGNEFARQKLLLEVICDAKVPARTGATGNGRVGVREKAHHLHVVGSVSYASRGHRCSARGFWRARASFERLRTPGMRPGPRSDAAARASSRFVAMISACCVWRCAPLRLLSTWVVKHGNFSDEYRVLGLRSPRMVHADLTLKL